MNSHRLEEMWSGDGCIGVDNRIMLMRFLGTLVAIAAATLVYVAVDGLSPGNEMARTLAIFAESNADSFDANDWLWRWRLSSGLLLILGVVGIVAGIGMVW